MFQCFLYHFPAFFVGIVGNGTGVNYIYIGSVLKIYFLEPTLGKKAGNGRCFGEVQLTAEGIEGNFFTHKAAKLRNLWVSCLFVKGLIIKVILSFQQYIVIQTTGGISSNW